MTTQIKAVLLASAAVALSATAQAQLPVSSYTANHNDILLGFTVPGSTGDLVIDLGTAAQIGVGGTMTVDLNLNGNVGESSAALQSELNGLYGSMNNLQWGAVGGHMTGPLNFSIYSTVAHNAGAPFAPGAPGQIVGAINTAGQGLNDFAGSPSNQGTVNPTAGYSESWTEIVAPGTLSSSFSSKYYNPDSTTPANFTDSQVEDLYLNTASSEQLVGYLTLFSTGNVQFTPVPEPGAMGMVAGLGVLAMSLRRYFVRR
jgi:hypothetical protein